VSTETFQPRPLSAPASRMAGGQRPSVILGRLAGLRPPGTRPGNGMRYGRASTMPGPDEAACW